MHLDNAVELPRCDFHFPADGFEGCGVDYVGRYGGLGAGYLGVVDM